MTVFWIVAALLVLGALLFIVPPLLGRTPTPKGISREQLNLSVYRNQLAELETDLNYGAISQEQFEQSRQDLERRLLEDVGREKQDSRPSQPEGRGAAGVVVVLLPLVAGWIYLSQGNLQALDAERTTRTASSDQAAQQGSQQGRQQGAQEEVTPERIEAMVEQLAARLEENPDDVRGWRMLGRAYSMLGRHQKATQAYTKALELAPQNAALLTDYADTLAMANGQSLAGKPMELVRRALELEPSNQKALWLAGTAAYEQGDYDKAVEYWQDLAQQVPAGSEAAEAMANNIAEAKALAAGQEPPAPTTSQSQAGESQAGASSGQNEPARVSGTVKLSERMRDKVSPGDTVFIFARAPDGPPMPVAVQRRRAGDLPVEFTLDDSQAMMPRMSLSNFGEVVVGARISKSGDAKPQSGDLEGTSAVVAVGRQDIQVTIDKVIP